MNWKLQNLWLLNIIKVNQGKITIFFQKQKLKKKIQKISKNQVKKKMKNFQNKIRNYSNN